MKISACLGLIFTKLSKAIEYCKKEYMKQQFNKCGESVYLGRNCSFTPKTMDIGDHVFIGSNCVLQSVHGKIIIGNYVMFGPGVHIHGGNHKFHEIGKYMMNVSEKELGEDGEVVIEDDCWVGANAIILPRVRIGRGSVIGAGAVVTKSLPPYTIYTGIPQQQIRRRFSEEQITEHESLLQ